MNLVKKFSIKSNSLVLDVQEPLEGFNPWLPANEISINESKWDSESFQVGKPINRKFTITTKGLSINQIPNLSSNLGVDSEVKTYADQPQVIEKINNSGIIGSRIEQYTVIPQKEGRVEFPEIKIKWWDVEKIQEKANKNEADIRQLKLDVSIITGIAGEMVQDGGQKKSKRRKNKSKRRKNKSKRKKNKSKRRRRSKRSKRSKRR